MNKKTLILLSPKKFKADETLIPVEVTCSAALETIEKLALYLAVVI